MASSSARHSATQRGQGGRRTQQPVDNQPWDVQSPNDLGSLVWKPVSFKHPDTGAIRSGTVVQFVRHGRNGPRWDVFRVRITPPFLENDASVLVEVARCDIHTAMASTRR
ncbi:hypothetical protein EXIGLDRAFT_731203 [Exidia glandulosa HHB12029]|uniref:Uncharacterized protein n=1 Tax=Exidia glandulosa HHB12029 TaxID=1314781 RepID=A0A165BYU9_EXIGL|nr:hypothetical protein EXIGLDRAFT_731203 [Exidia glandulosa HHB12029]